MTKAANSVPVDGEVWILVPVHNRRNVTQACLDNLRSLGIFDRFTVCVIDDGSTDGTTAMLSRDFPEAHVISGSGSLFWGGGIAVGMQEACAQGAGVIVWLNDDCILSSGSIEILVARVRETKGICGAVCFDPLNPTLVTYSGARQGIAGAIHPLAGKFETADSLNGNLVAIHREVIVSVGIVDHQDFPHYGADLAYTIKARRAGFVVEISGDSTALNARGRPFERFGTTVPAAAVFREPFRIGSILYWPAYWNLLKLSCGWRAWYRWPAYFLRLVKHWISALWRSVRNHSGD